MHIEFRASAKLCKNENCALERGDDDSFNSARSTSQGRDLTSKKQELKEKWESINELLEDIIQIQFRRHSLKGDQLKIENPKQMMAMTL